MTRLYKSICVESWPQTLSLPRKVCPPVRAKKINATKPLMEELHPDAEALRGSRSKKNLFPGHCDHCTFTQSPKKLPKTVCNELHTSLLCLQTNYSNVYIISLNIQRSDLWTLPHIWIELLTSPNSGSCHRSARSGNWSQWPKWLGTVDEANVLKRIESDIDSTWFDWSVRNVKNTQDNT